MSLLKRLFSLHKEISSNSESSKRNSTINCTVEQLAEQIENYAEADGISVGNILSEACFFYAWARQMKEKGYDVGAWKTQKFRLGKFVFAIRAQYYKLDNCP